MLLAIVGGLLSRGTTAPRPSTAPEESFSAERAAAAAAPLVQEPRPIGSEANTAAHDHLAERLAAAGFEVTSTEGIGQRAAEGTGSAGYVRNLVATRPGSDPTGTLVLATHIDSVPHGPGAADAGVGLAVILETVRALGPEARAQRPRDPAGRRGGERTARRAGVRRRRR
ncbi:M28 family peptidase [Brachybacterium sp. GPGPB12]|uniref:M28 family peptidase n=1 Tax=Brachybacterium sp. GPGPB12 TaxID=3023517 RepID=UPI0031342A40